MNAQCVCGNVYSLKEHDVCPNCGAWMALLLASTPAEAAERCIAIIESEPEFPGNIFREMGFWAGLRMTVWMALHPYGNARATARMCKRKLVERIRGEFPQEAARV